MKRLLSLLLVIAMLFGVCTVFTACDSTSVSDKDEDEDDKKKDDKDDNEENEDDEGMYEINLSAQFLNRPISEIASTLIHEMCHQFAKVNDFKDTARSGSFHNKLFRQIAEDHGLNVELNGGRGWAVTTLKESTKRLLDGFIEQNPKTPVYRVMPIKPKRVRNLSVRKYICPDCEASVRATKAVNVMCGDCMKQMQEEKI